MTQLSNHSVFFNTSQLFICFLCLGSHLIYMLMVIMVSTCLLNSCLSGLTNVNRMLNLFCQFVYVDCWWLRMIVVNVDAVIITIFKSPVATSGNDSSRKHVFQFQKHDANGLILFKSVIDTPCFRCFFEHHPVSAHRSVDQTDGWSMTESRPSCTPRRRPKSFEAPPASAARGAGRGLVV